MSRLRQLIREIHRRSLWQVMLIYIGAAWACFELIATVADTMGLPAWLPGLAIVLFLLGLPFVVATACVREDVAPPTEGAPATEEGTRVEAEHRAAVKRRRFLTWRNAGLSFLVALSVWGVVATGWMLFALRDEAETERRMIVVLPFENLGAPEDEYFADGLTDAINARLASVQALGVISRQSAMQYKGSSKKAREIGDELGVSYILEGTVQRERPGDPESRLRVIPQLIRIEDDTHLWAETYDNDGSELFRVQSDIAERVARALDITIAGSERRALEARPTENLEAHDYYVRALEYYLSPRVSCKNAAIAAELLLKAIELDPDFPLAYAWLSRTRSRSYRDRCDSWQETGAAAKQAAERALELQPELPEAHGAMGYYYYNVERDWNLSIQWSRSALDLRPNDARILGDLALAQRRLGDLEQALPNFELAYELDPIDQFRIQNLCSTYIGLRRYPDAERMLDRYIALFPNLTWPYFWKAWGLVSLAGRPEEARQILELGTEKTDVHPLWWFADAATHRERSLFRVLHESYLDAALEADYPASDTVGSLMLKALAHRMSGSLDESRIYYDSARVAEQRRQAESDEYRSGGLGGRLGIIYAGLGRGEDAVRYGLERIEALKAQQNVMEMRDAVVDLAEIYIMIGNHDAAIDQLDEVLSTPHGVGRALLRLDPLYDPLRDHPRFQALLGRTSSS